MKYRRDLDFHRTDFGSFYDELPLWSAPFGRMLLERVPLRPDATILDVGAGTGFLGIELAQRCGPGSTVFAVDSWPEAVRRLRAKLEYFEIENVRVIEGDAAELDVPDGSIDLVVSNLGINNFENAAEVLRRCHRATRSGGELWLSTNLTGHMQELYDAFRETLEDVGLPERIPALEEHVAHRGTVESVRELVESAGFEVFEVARDSFRIRFASGAAIFGHYFLRLGFVSAWRDLLPAEDVEKTFDRLVEKLDRLAEEEGDIALTIPVAVFGARRA